MDQAEIRAGGGVKNPMHMGNPNRLDYLSLSLGGSARFGSGMMRLLYLVSVWTHILAVAVWVGGMVFLVLVLVPATRQLEERPLASRLISWTGKRFRWIGWISLGLLLATGIFNLAYRGYTWGDLWSGALFNGFFGRTLGVKLLLVAVVFGLSALHDFVIGPRASQRARRESGSAEALRYRRAASWMGRLNLILALVIVLLGVMLVRGGP
ncbi:MAG: DUF4149 domain-containing protein [Anaerolineales bacterium]|nr:DUF4149 domain-containing protein [Anaerolineales bacterium]